MKFKFKNKFKFKKYFFCKKYICKFIKYKFN